MWTDADAASGSSVFDVDWTTGTARMYVRRRSQFCWCRPDRRLRRLAVRRGSREDPQ